MRNQGCRGHRHGASRRVCAHIADLEVGVAVSPARADDVVVVLDRHQGWVKAEVRNSHADPGWPSATALGKICRWETSPI
jgi:hypothetical protein